MSKKFMTRPRALCAIGPALSISTTHSDLIPKDIAPKKILETLRTLLPSLAYCMPCSPLPSCMDRRDSIAPRHFLFKPSCKPNERAFFPKPSHELHSYWQT